MTQPIRLLTFSTLYPSQARPHHGVFVENRLRHLVESGEAVATVLAPVPWRGGAGFRGSEEIRHGLRVLHPAFLALPGLLTSPATLHFAARRVLRRLIAEGVGFDLVDGHYLYPDGVVALRLGREFGLPVVLTGRGSDVSQLPRHWPAGRAIRRALREADALIAVSEGLKQGMVALGADPARVTVLRNGVDLQLFRPDPARGPAGRVLLSVGLLIARKGHDRIIAALPALPGFQLDIIGEGPERAALLAQAAALGVAERVRMLGAVPHGGLRRHYAAADALVLASSREGWANVLLEAMACGTPVLASPAWGSREAVRAPEAGIVLDDASPGSIAAGVRTLFAALPDRAATRRYAEGFGWDETTAGQLQVFRHVLAARA
jgi:glycosyltransferase involved in cell wall biosynthesis